MTGTTGKAGGVGTANTTALGATGVAGAPPVTSRAGAVADEVIPIAEESLRVGKRDVNHGRVRLRSYVIETPVNEQIALRNENVQIDRRTVDRAPTAADERLFPESRARGGGACRGSGRVEGRARDRRSEPQEDGRGSHAGHHRHSPQDGRQGRGRAVWPCWRHERARVHGGDRCQPDRRAHGRDRPRTAPRSAPSTISMGPIVSSSPRIRRPTASTITFRWRGSRASTATSI